MDLTESPKVTEVSAVARVKGGLRAKQRGQPTGSLDEWGGGREERTEPMDVTESPMVTEVRNGVL